MAEPSTEDYLEKFRVKLQQCTVRPKVRKDWTSADFVLSTKLTDWLNAPAEQAQSDSNIAVLLDAAYTKYPTEHPPNVVGGNDGQKRFALTFCILLELQLGHLLHCFLRCGIHDNKLPLPLNLLRDKVAAALNHSPDKDLNETSCQDLANKFNSAQWKYFPVKFAYRDENEWLRPQVFPFVDRQLITRKGGTAEVYEVAVPEAFVDKGLIKLSPTNTYHPDFQELGSVCRFALKVFRDGYKHLWKQEIDAYKTLGDKKGMVHYLGNFSHVVEGEGLTHNIMLEFADNDLVEYFHLSSPVLSGQIAAFWNKLLPIVLAIKEFHNFEEKRLTRNKSTPIKGYHADIKPDNILSVGQNFKLADPGFAKFWRLQGEMENQGLEHETQGGTTTYAAPELFTPDVRHVDPTKCDMWSLGCVLSEAATWMVLGYTGTRQYSRFRQKAIQRLPQTNNSAEQSPLRQVKGGDCFHDGVSVLSEVLQWHDFLRSMVKPTDSVTPHILDMIDKGLFARDTKGRPTAEILWKWWTTKQDTFHRVPAITVPQNITEILQEAVVEEVDQLSRTFQSLGTQDAGARKAVKSSTSFLQVLAPAKASLSPTAAIGLSISGTRQDEHLSLSPANSLVSRARSKSSTLHDSALRVNGRSRRSESVSNWDRVTVFDSYYLHLADEEHQSKLSERIKRNAGKKNKDPRLVKDIVNRDLIFLVDNGETMQEHWAEARFVLENLVKCTWNIDSDGVELRFAKGPKEVQGKGKKAQDLQLFKNAMQDDDVIPTPKTLTDMSHKLEIILSGWLTNFESLRNKQKAKFLTIIVLTDGKWEGMRYDPLAVDKSIIKFHKHLMQATNGWPLKRCVSIQFISFGNDLDALDRLRRLDEDLGVEGVPDIVDTVPSTGDVYKMLLGSILDEWDHHDDYAPEETSSPSELEDPFRSASMTAAVSTGSPSNRRTAQRDLPSVGSEAAHRRSSASRARSIPVIATPTP